MDWLRQQWDDIKGNAKWWALCLGVTATGSVRAFFWEWFRSLAPTLRFLYCVVGVETIGLIVLVIKLTNKRHELKKSLDEPGKGPAELPSEVQTDQSRGSAPALKGRLALRLQEKTDQELAIRVGLENVDLVPIDQCSLILINLGKWHPEMHEFRKPTFYPLALVGAMSLEPQQSSSLGLVVRLKDLSARELEIPTGGYMGQRDYCAAGGRWRAQLEVRGAREKYRDELIFDWWPGQAPSLITGGRKQPLLTYSDLRPVGFSDPASNLGSRTPDALALFVQNTEMRFQSEARNLHAYLRLRSADDQELAIDDAPWFQNLATDPPGHYYKQTVTIGMLDTAGVLLAIRRESTYFAAHKNTSTSPATGQSLTWGDWYVDLRIEGENVWQEMTGQLRLLPNGVTRCTLST